MALTLGSDAYATSEEVAAYWEARDDEIFEDADEAAQEAAIRVATAYLDANFTWVGRIEDSEQALGWPRVCAHDSESRKLEDIPIRVKDATAELAKLALGGPLVPMSLSTGQAAIKREKMGPAEIEYDTSAGVTDAGYDYVVSLLRGIGRFANGSGSLKVIRT